MAADKKVFRAIDANFNRCKEGLRVVEDCFRFILEDDKLRKKVRTIRHELDEIAREKALLKGIANRDSISDLGKDVDTLEFNRKTVTETIYINLQRAKESLRALEEFLKLTTPGKVALIKKLRYKVYTLEKTIILKWPPRII